MVWADLVTPDLAAAEMPARSPGQALESRRQRGQVLGVLAGQSGRGSDGQAVAGQDHRLVDLRDAGHQVVKKPVQLTGRTRLAVLALLRRTHFSPCRQSSPSVVAGLRSGAPGLTRSAGARG